MTYKDLVVMSYAKNKSAFILKNGVDFDTFGNVWKIYLMKKNMWKKFINKSIKVNYAF